jgi:uncharacterized protein YjbI with pentapeptide repeats
VSGRWTDWWRAHRLAVSLAAATAAALAIVLVIDWVPNLLADTERLTDAEEAEEVGRTRTALEVQAALAVIKRRNESFDEHRLNLRSTALRGAKLPDADLDGADIADADFRDVIINREVIAHAKNVHLAKNLHAADGDAADEHS